MKQPKLLDVPKCAPSLKERIEAFKAKHSIETHCAGVKWRTGDFMPWVACHMPTARQYGYGVTAESDLFDCISKVGRLLDESGVMGYGDTEREAIRATCETVNIPCEL